MNWRRTRFGLAWAELLGRLPAAGLFPKDAALIRRIQALAPRPRERN